MAAEKNNKIKLYRNFSWLNIGTLLFGAIFIYMIITVLVYLTAKHTTTYEVTAGSISGNYRYTALALKSEEIVNADYSGYITYYARNGAKCGAGMPVCSIDEYAKSAQSRTVEFTDDEYEALGGYMASFALHFNDSAYQDVYNFKSEMEGYVLQNTDSPNASQYLLNQVAAPSSGFVSYMIDGMESVTESDLTQSMFNRTGYSAQNLRLNEQVHMGDPLYKLVKGEEWYLYFPVSTQLATELEDRSTIRFRFLKDDTTFQAGFSILMSDGEYYGRIALRNSLVRYVNDRYLDIELLMDSKKGLKIPTSAIAEKTFCRIPEDYVIENVNSVNEITLLRERFRKDDSSSVSYVTATVYDKQDGYYLVSKDLFRAGDYLQQTGSSKKRQITDEDMVQVQGVFNINKGYAVFREVTLIDANEEFCIVEPYSPYGLAAHDYIVLDASTVKDDDIIY